MEDPVNTTKNNEYGYCSEDLWCVECGNQSISYDPGLENHCDYCIWKHYRKSERYDIYNDFWTEHYIEIGRLLPSVNKTHEPYKTAYSFIKPDTFLVEIKNKEYIDNPENDTRVLVPLGTINKKPIIPRPPTPPPKHEGSWASLFPENNKR